MSSMRNATVQCDAETRGTLSLYLCTVIQQRTVRIPSYQHFFVYLWNHCINYPFCITSFRFKSPNKSEMLQWFWSGSTSVFYRSLNKTLPVHTLTVSFYKPMIILTPCGHQRYRSRFIFHIDLFDCVLGQRTEISRKVDPCMFTWAGLEDDEPKQGKHASGNTRPRNKQTMYIFAVKPVCHIVVFVSCQVCSLVCTCVLTIVATYSFPS